MTVTPKLTLTSLQPDSITFTLDEYSLSYADSLRRVSIAKVATLAIDIGDVRADTSPFDRRRGTDEYLAHRLDIPRLDRQTD